MPYVHVYQYVRAHEWKRNFDFFRKGGGQELKFVYLLFY